MEDVVWLIPALPLAGFLVILLFGRRLGDPLAGWVATTMASASFLVTVGVWLELLSPGDEERRITDVVWSRGSLSVGSRSTSRSWPTRWSVTMALFVTGVGSLIHLYSIGYMRGDPKFSKFFLYMNLFLLSMLVLVLGNNMLATFLGWKASASAPTS